MRFLNEIQVAVLFDRAMGDLETIVRTFAKIEESKTGARFNVPEANPGRYYRLFGGDELMITFEYCDQPCDPAVFRQTLASTVTGLLCPDIRQRLTCNRTHVLINVSHGVLGNVVNEPGIAAMLQQIGMPREGASLPQFMRRLDIAALAARIVSDCVPPQAVHWTQSNQLLAGEAFEGFAAMPAPGPLHIHPYLFGQTQTADGKPKLGIRTFGARHFIGGELVIEPSVLPWAANYETMLAFLRVATTENGYIIPDGDTFGPEDRSLSYRVLHRPAEEGDVPLFELVPLKHEKYGFEADDYVPRERAFDDRNPPADLMPEDQDEKFALANEWREKRKLAEGIGGGFEVRARGPEGDATPPVRPGGQPTPGSFGNRPVFGRKRVG